MSYGRSDNKIYVGNLPPDIRERDIEDLFYKYGRIVDIDLKNRRGPPFAFVEFDDPRDAQDAISKRDNYDYDGYKLRVESPRGHNSGHRGGGEGGGRGRGFGRGGGGHFHNRKHGMSGGGENNNSGVGPSRRTEFRVFVKGLPPTGSWQDLKDHMREAGDVAFADVFKDGTGMVEFLRKDDMKYAVKRLDDSKFRSHEGETSYIRVIEDRGGNSGGGGGAAGSGGAGGSSAANFKGRSRSRTRSRSNSFSPRRTRRSPSYSSMKRSNSRSRSGSRSRSRERNRLSPY